MNKNIGIDLGTANVLIHLKGRGIVCNQPAVLAVDQQSGQVVAFGEEAYDMIGRTSDTIKIIRPLKGGVIADHDYAQDLLSLLMESVFVSSWFNKPTVLICTPSTASEVDQLALIETVQKIGVRSIHLSKEPIVAAVGAGIDIFDSRGSMVIDIGGGTSDFAVIARGQLIQASSIKVAGDNFDQNIIDYFRDHKKIKIGQRMAESVKIAIASAKPLEDAQECTYAVKGQDAISGLPKSLNVHANDIQKAIAPSLHLIARAGQDVIESLDPDIAADILESGIILTGGGAYIRFLDEFLTEALNISVITVDQPMTTVAIGTGMMLDYIQTGKMPLEKSTWRDQLHLRLKRLFRRLFG